MTAMRAEGRRSARWLGVVSLLVAGTAWAQVSRDRPAGALAAPGAGPTGTKGGVLLDVATTPSATAGDTPAAAALPVATQALLDEINRRRAEGATCGAERRPPAPPMRWNALLFRAADLHVRDMAPQRGGSISHTGSNGSDVGARAEAAGYRWKSVGENVAAGRPTALATLAQWMASPGHCANIMNPGFVDVAVAGLHLPGTNYNHYWVMVLGRP